MAVVTKIDTLPDYEKRLKVCAYARVSCGKDAMLHSLSSQVSYYSRFIQNNPKWEYVGVYADEAMTGTKDTRTNFQKMIADSKEGKIDLIITKSISRFARNTLTLLKVVRELKDIDVDIFFEEQNIHSLSSDGEMILTLLASFAQEESRSVSENMKWRIKKDFEQGIIWGGKDNYGYDIINKKFVVNPEKAKVIKRIFNMALEGYGQQSIANILNKEGIPSPYNKKWCKNCISIILNNSNYTGDLVLQKTFRENHLTKKRKDNKGELNKYIVEGNHEAIISKELFQEVQEVLATRALHYKCKNNSGIKYPFSSKLKCSICGKNYKHAVKGKRGIWICTTFTTIGKEACSSKQIPESQLYEVINEALGFSKFDEEKFSKLVNFIEVCPDNLLKINLFSGEVIETKWKDRQRKDSWTPEMKEQARQRALKQLGKGDNNGKC